jgi:short-subunit dehydrogenase
MDFFKNKVIVITGSTQGIGKRTAELLAARGAFIVINSRSIDSVAVTVHEFKTKGYTVFGSSGDVSNLDYCRQLRNEVIEKYGKIDLLINNAGIAVCGTMDQTNDEIIEHATKINFLGSIYPTKVFLSDLIESKGGIIFISSLAGVIGLPGYVLYASSKRAIVSVAESLKNELIDKEVFIGVNYPGFTENDPRKEMTFADGKIKKLSKRKNVKVDSLNKTVNSIIKQIEQRKFRKFSSIKGYLIYMFNGIAPCLSLFILKMNRKKIMSMD